VKVGKVYLQLHMTLILWHHPRKHRGRCIGVVDDDSKETEAAVSEMETFSKMCNEA
jgi:hypothetical protein